MKKPILAVTACFSLLTAAHAHSTGHEGGVLETVHHLLTQPNHLLMLLASLAVVGLVAFKFLRPSNK